MPEFEISRLDQRPHLADQLYEPRLESWPTFMAQDRVSNALFSWAPAAHPGTTVVATEESGTVVGRGLAVPFALDVPGRGTLPDGGWDQVLMWAFVDYGRHAPADSASALEIIVDPDHRGNGLSGRLLAAMRDAVREQGVEVLYAPVRPSAKHLEPELPIAEYVARTRDDGLPHDPWLRVHARAGGRIVGPAPASMQIGGSLAQWREWTGLPFDTDGSVIVPEALVPVHCDTTHDHAVYVEPNVWVRYDLR